MSLNSIMQIGLTGMFAAGASMQTSSHNIANANTPGFTRQRAITGSMRGMLTAYGVLGSGTEVMDIRRMTDQFLITHKRDQMALMNQFDTERMALQNVEVIFGSVDNNHLGEAMSQFFNAWSTLATPPHNEVLRMDVLGTAERLALDFNAMSSSLQDLGNDLDDRLVAGVNSLNTMLDNVADLNRQIVLGESSHSTANDLRDRRDILLASISQLVRADVIERGDGTVDVIIAGRTVVSHDHVQHLDVTYEDSGDFQRGTAKITVKDGRYNVDIGEGQLKGLMRAREVRVLGVRQQLDEMTKLLIDKVNEIHVQGLSHGGRGLQFFTGDSAATIAVNTQLVDNPEYIATSRSNLAGDKDIALEIAALGLSGTDVENNMSMTELFSALVVEIASDTAASAFRVEGQQQLVDSLDARLESIRGVSLDEEAANLALYQNVYQANARVISAVQEMFDSVLTMV